MKPWFWNRRRRVFVDSSDDQLSKAELKDSIEEYIDSIQEDIDSKSRDYVAGAITLAALFSFLDDEISAMHGATGAIAFGGLEQMDTAKWESIDGRLQTELDYLSGFRDDVEAAVASGEELSADGISARAGLYAEAAYSEYVTQTVVREAENGVTMGRRICEEDNASCEECVAAASEDFMPLDDIEEIGSLECMSNCRCEIEFSNEDIILADVIPSGVVGESAAVN